MKKFLFIVAAAALMMTACKKDDAPVKISFSPRDELQEVPQPGMELMLHLKANGAWVANVGGSLDISVDPAQGNGDAEVVITVAESLDGEEGEGTVTFAPAKGNGKGKTITFKQEGLTSIEYGGRSYNVVKLKDGNVWFAENLAYIPEGYTPCDKLDSVTAGVYYPVVVKADQTGAEFSKDQNVIKSNGYLYQAEVALGLKINAIKSEAEAKALEGAQGICPDGWHIPTLADILGLVGKVAQVETNTKAPYYVGSDCSLDSLNKDGFNIQPCGAISIQDNTKVTGSFTGWLSAYKDRLTSGMYCGSSFKTITYNTANDATSGIKNIGFHGLMPMTNKASASQYTCNGTGVSYKIAAPVRCVKDKK